MSEFDTGYKMGVKEASGEIEKLRRQLAEAHKVIEFYGDENNWDGYGNNQFVDIDSEDYTQEYINAWGERELELIGNFGGEKARQYLEKYKGE